MPEEPLIPAETGGQDHSGTGLQKIVSQTSEHHPLSSPTLHGLLFDATVFAGWILFLFGFSPIPNLDSIAVEWGSDAGVSVRMVGLWLVGGLLAQVLGAFFKGPFLRHRLAGRKHSPGKALKRLMVLLWWAHFLFFTLIAAFSLMLLGWMPPETDEITGSYMLWGTTVFTLGGLTTWAARWATRPATARSPAPPSYYGLEYLGDILLLASVLILTRFMWDPMAQLFTTGEIGFDDGLVRLIARVVLFLCMLILFGAFYLPPRLLYLVEDGHHRRTWIQMGIVLIPLTWHVFFGL